MSTRLRRLFAAAALVTTLTLHAVEPGKPPQLTSPALTPQGLEKAAGVSLIGAC